MALSAGTRLGPYEILAAVGAGGMGEVYRARDTRLERTVAIKVLPSHLSQSEEVRQRFEREAKTISSLSHPHICALYDVGNQDGVEYLVMEFLEGETLTDRLAKGALPSEQVLRNGIEIADALDKAHRQGIVHRDLKPGNVMLTKSGVKLLDFGLAKAVAPASSTAGLSVLPTQAGANLTQEGTILGTFQYMAPEQLEGKEADVRSDIFAFGAVLYEMATGQKAFSGKSQASLIGAIMHTEPPAVSTVQPMTPPALDRVVKTCLAKDPEDRFQTAHDVKLQLQWIAEGGSLAGVPAPVTARRRSRERLWMSAAAGIFAAAALAFGYFLGAKAREPTRLIQTSILPPEKTHFDWGRGGAIALSPDGRRLAFVATGSEGGDRLFVRPLNAGSAQPLAGADPADHPFWSPDSRFIGFFSGGKLKKIDASGGPPETICNARIGRGGSWNRDGVIAFVGDNNDSIFRVSSSGGTPVQVTELDASRGENTHRLPVFLPDGRHFLYLARGVGDSTDAISIGSLDSKKSEILLRASSTPGFAPSSPGSSAGHLIYWREGTLMAQPFDAKARRLTAEAFPIAEHVSRTPGGFAIFSVSENGLLAYHGGGDIGVSQLTWFDRGGKQLEAVGTPAGINRPRLSHDGTRVAADLPDPQTGATDIWIYDLSRHTQSRFTFDPANDSGPVWSPDDTRILFSSDRKKTFDLYEKPATGTGREEPLLVSDIRKFAFDWSADGRWILFSTQDPKTRFDLWAFSVPDKKPIPFLRTEFNEVGGRLSPDGRWMSYQSDESGTFEVYVQAFPGPGGKWQVSTGGGSNAQWRRDGKELFYVAPGDKIMSVEVKTADMFVAGTPKLLFSAPLSTGSVQRYDVSADGQRFLVNIRIVDTATLPITLVQNWATGRGR